MPSFYSYSTSRHPVLVPTLEHSEPFYGKPQPDHIRLVDISSLSIKQLLLMGKDLVEDVFEQEKYQALRGLSSQTRSKIALDAIKLLRARNSWDGDITFRRAIEKVIDRQYIYFLGMAKRCQRCQIKELIKQEEVSPITVIPAPQKTSPQPLIIGDQVVSMNSVFLASGNGFSDAIRESLLSSAVRESVDLKRTRPFMDETEPFRLYRKIGLSPDNAVAQAMQMVKSGNQAKIPFMNYTIQSQLNQNSSLLKEKAFLHLISTNELEPIISKYFSNQDLEVLAELRAMHKEENPKEKYPRQFLVWLQSDSLDDLNNPLIEALQKKVALFVQGVDAKNQTMKQMQKQLTSKIDTLYIAVEKSFQQSFQERISPYTAMHFKPDYQQVANLLDKTICIWNLDKTCTSYSPGSEESSSEVSPDTIFDVENINIFCDGRNYYGMLVNDRTEKTQAVADQLEESKPRRNQEVIPGSVSASALQETALKPRQRKTRKIKRESLTDSSGNQVRISTALINRLLKREVLNDTQHVYKRHDGTRVFVPLSTHRRIQANQDSEVGRMASTADVRRKKTVRRKRKNETAPVTQQELTQARVRFQSQPEIYPITPRNNGVKVESPSTTRRSFGQTVRNPLMYQRSARAQNQAPRVEQGGFMKRLGSMLSLCKFW